MRRSLRFLAAAVLLGVVLGPAAARAQEFDNDVRLRIAGYFPFGLPTDVGTMWGLEVRNLLTARDGMAYGIYFFDEQRTDFIDLNYGGTPTVFTFHADVKMTPVLISWFHIWPMRSVTLFAGVGAGLYPVKAFSGGYSETAGVQIKDFGDFRYLEDETLIGAHVYGGIDFFPDSRFGLSAEARFHLVENSYSAAEASLAGIFRF